MSDDPYYEREKAKYDNPVASREHLLSVLKESGKPLSFIDICLAVNADNEDNRIGIQRRLRAMEREGQIQFTKQKRYAIQKQADLIQGKVLGHRDGFGFLRPDDGSSDLYISAGQMQLFMHGDIVEARESGTDRKGRREAYINRVINPRNDLIVGRFFTEKGFAMVVPDDSRLQYEIVIPQEHVQGARQGNIVVVEIVQRPRRRVSPVGKIVEVLGEHMAPGMEIEMALRTFDIPHVWPKAVEQEMKSVGSEVEESAKQGRIDLRQLPLVTIDGEDARDFDDAVFCEPLDEGGWQLWVAIADVSHYVKSGSALDKEALERGNSVYFPDNVIPMLPTALSNGLCSLNPDVDRLCMVCELSLSAQGKVTGYQFYEAVMRSHARLTYNKVWAILQGDKELYQRYEDKVPQLRNLYAMFKTLKKVRTQRGAIEFETQESKFVFNAQRKIDTIVPLVRNDAHKIIEECMILANVCAAKFLEDNKANSLYRVHDKPDQDRLTSLTSYLSEIGVPHQLNDESTPADFAAVVAKTAARTDAELIQTMLLRSMKQAIYDGENIGHFGLSLSAYAHFTSPIRRYPDLIVHRSIKGLLKKQGQRVSGAKLYNAEEIEHLGEQCSTTERRADDATRDVSDWLKCEFMLDHVGESFDGVVASVTGFGMFVRLGEYHIDGLVHISSLEKDYYHFDEVKQCLLGEASGQMFRLGDSVSVQVAAVNLDERKIDLIIDPSTLKSSSGKKINVRKRAKTVDKRSGIKSSSKTRGSAKRGQTRGQSKKGRSK